MNSTTYHLADPLSPYIALKRHFSLIVQMAKRDVIGRYRGSFMGLLWSFVNPLLMLIIYTFVFGVVLKARWGAQPANHFQYAIVLFAGLNINTLFSECATRAPTLMIANVNFVKRVVFPLETLSWSTLGAALFHLGISTIVLLVVVLAVNGHLTWTVFLFPIIVLAFLPFVAGIVWLFASLGVFLRDLNQIVTVLITAMMFMAPILYPMSTIPEKYRDFMYLNPLTVIALASQDVLIWGRQPSWIHLGIYVLASTMFAWLAFAWFQRTKKGFADVL